MSTQETTTPVAAAEPTATPAPAAESEAPIATQVLEVDDDDVCHPHFAFPAVFTPFA